MTTWRSEAAAGRRYPVGAELVEGGVHFRVWAPRARSIAVAVEDGPVIPLASEPEGYFSGLVADAGAGLRYRYEVDGEKRYPDPASRFQPEGPHGPSQVIDPARYRWRDADWAGVELHGQVLYELHVGTFTPEGSWAAAALKLPFLKELGVTVIEMMPVNEFPGRFGWGYDGVDLFAPTRLYGSPDDLRAFIDAAHGLGMGVIHDVVYNHFGPDGCYLNCFAPYTSDKHANEWGESVNFDGEGGAGVREFVLANAAYWIDEFHFDGLRVDATQAIMDDSPEHILAGLTKAAREAAPGRSVIIVGENEPQHARLMRPFDIGGYGFDALWNDDFHHSAMVALTGRAEAYFKDHEGSPQEFVSAAKYGFLFQGQFYAWQAKRRGAPAGGVRPAQFVMFLENHDQVANHAPGERLVRRTSPGRLRAATALTLLMPGTPMLFQGQEFGSTKPFIYFADHTPDLAELVRHGRRGFLDQFQSVADEAGLTLLSPEDPAAFEACKLDWDECERNVATLALHRDLLRLRREDPVFASQGALGVDGAVLGPEAFLLRFFGQDGDDRLLLVNFGRDLVRSSLAEPLAAPPEGRLWRCLWSSESPAYGGAGTPVIESPTHWRIPGHAAVALSGAPAEAGEAEPQPA
ncbi:malto-oligosyltrehalose trehalohydrolase [Alsobacter sp. KACC 23698]|uniref:Malto-oligosyltrehalose trehalohydrolase n=1 Tax=Alsobacter sp. KACC 23698 TaxID=3149229 RepID=A0AAU7JGQ9_9HYPH